MIPKEKVELVELAIRQLMEKETKEKLSSSSDDTGVLALDDGDDYQMCLSSLLSQLEERQLDGNLLQPDQPSDPKELNPPAACEAKSEATSGVAGGGNVDDSGRDEIIKELKKVKRQNLITHCLLSALIVITVAWQLSEVSLVLKIKEGLDHPFKSLGGMLKGMIRGPPKNGQNGENQNQSSAQQQQIEGPPLPPLRIPELPHLDMPLGSESDDG